MGGRIATLADRFSAELGRNADPNGHDVERLPSTLSRACVAVLPIDGAGLSVIDQRFRVPLGASGDDAETAERLQFTQGDGPCLSAAAERRTLAADEATLASRWPLYAQELFARTTYRAAISTPLWIGEDLRGALDIYLEDDRRLANISVADVATLAEQVTTAIRQRTEPTGANAAHPRQRRAWLEGPAAGRRTTVWVATGILMTTLHMPASDALAVLRGYAIGRSLDVDTVAASLVRGDLEPRAIRG